MPSRPLPVSKLKAKRRKQRLVISIVICVSILALLGAVIGFSWLPYIRIQDIEVTGAQSVSPDTIKEDIQKDLAGRVGIVFPRSNALLYPREDAEDMLLKKYPVFLTVDIHRLNITTLAVNIVERQAQALWCGRSGSNPSPCYLLDQNGVVYAPAADFSGQVYVKYYGETSTTTPEHYLYPELFKATASFVERLRLSVQGDIPRSVEVADGGADVRFESGFVLKYSVGDTAEDVLARLAIALQTAPFPQHKLSDFEYLDLRFGDKLYYRLK